MDVTPDFDRWTQRLGGWVDRVLDDGTPYREREVVALTLEEVAQVATEALAARIAAVKAEAARRILLVAPEWMQLNLTARAAELALLYPGTRGDELPEPERSEYLAGQAVWDRIRAIRAASNQIEARLMGATNRAALLAVDISVGWPD